MIRKNRQICPVSDFSAPLASTHGVTPENIFATPKRRFATLLKSAGDLAFGKTRKPRKLFPTRPTITRQPRLRSAQWCL